MVEALLRTDAAFLEWIVALPHPDWLNWILNGASRAGVGGAIWLVAAAVLLFAGQIHRKDAARLVLAIVMVHAVVDVVVKPWVDRPRPPLANPQLQTFADVPRTRSFPSGHAANATAAALVMSRVWRRGGVLVWPVAAIVGVARVYLGIHYPLDAIGGCVFGLLCASVALLIPMPGRPRNGSVHREP
jgi:undecaprenyl-diphosphatase